MMASDIAKDIRRNIKLIKSVSGPAMVMGGIEGEKAA